MLCFYYKKELWEIRIQPSLHSTKHRVLSGSEDACLVQVYVYLCFIAAVASSHTVPESFICPPVLRGSKRLLMRGLSQLSKT